VAPHHQRRPSRPQPPCHRHLPSQSRHHSRPLYQSPPAPPLPMAVAVPVVAEGVGGWVRLPSTEAAAAAGPPPPHRRHCHRRQSRSRLLQMSPLAAAVAEVAGRREVAVAGGHRPQTRPTDRRRPRCHRSLRLPPPPSPRHKGASSSLSVALASPPQHESISSYLAGPNAPGTHLVLLPPPMVAVAEVEVAQRRSEFRGGESSRLE
jgi:hypothetical protein